MSEPAPRPNGRAWTWVGVVVAALILLWLLRPVILPFALGFAIAYVLGPMVDRLTARKLPRALAVALAMSAFLAVIVLVVLLVAPILVKQGQALVAALPGLAEKTAGMVRELLDKLPARPEGDPATPLRDAGQRIAQSLGSIANAVVGGGLAVLELLVALALAPIIASYLMMDWPRLVTAVEDALPREHEKTLRSLLGEIDTVLRGFISGTLLICLALAALYGVGLTVIGTPYGLALGILAGLFSVVPYVGTVFGLVVAVGATAAQYWPEWQQPVLALALFVGGQILSDYFLAPRLIGDRVRLHPLWIVFGLFAGGALFGVLGLLLAVPVLASAGVLVRFAYARYRESDLYKGDGHSSGGRGA